MIPDNITSSHILRAIASISKKAIPPHRKSTRFDLRIKSRKFPPKYVISWANFYANKMELSSERFTGGHETNNFLIARGFEILDKRGRPIVLEPVDEDEASSFPEGRASYEKHRRLERDSRIAKSAKRLRMRKHGRLSCDACGFSFESKYGSRGSGFIEAHHLIPVSKLKGKKHTRISDIALLCSNCHRIVHRYRPWLTISKLKSIILMAKKKLAA